MQSNVEKRIPCTKWTETKIGLDEILHFFCFLSVLFIGADIFGVNVGVNLRLDQVFLVLFSLCLALKSRFTFTKNLWILLFLFTSLISTLFAVDIKRGILFYFSILYNIVFVFYAFSNYVKYYGLTKFVQILRITCYIQFFIIFLQYLLIFIFNYEIPFLPIYGRYMGIPRFKLWFYEPSYLANYMLFWFVISVYMYLIGNRKKYLLDIILSLFILVLSTSTTGIVGIFISVIFLYFLWVNKGVTIKKVIAPLILILIGIILYFVFKDIFDIFIGRLFNSTLNDASGGRIKQWAETFKVFKENPIFGIGPGNYGLYLGKDTSYVPSNVTLELMATLGICGTIAFFMLTISLMAKSMKIAGRVKSQETYLLKACTIGLLIFFIILQVNQGYLRLYHWMFFGILEGGIYNIKIKNNLSI